MNYLGHFGLREFPFNLTPDTAFLFETRSIREALATLLVAVRGGEGLVTITGEVGTGKTLLCRKLAAVTDPGWLAIQLPNPSFDPPSLYLALAEGLRVAHAVDMQPHERVKAITLALLGFARLNKRVILCVDESQTMSLETFEALRLLTNLETDKRKLLQVVLFGQPELDRKLASPNLRHLQQRVSSHHQMGLVAQGEVEGYVGHRMATAGYGGRPILSSAVALRLHELSGGSPRLLNVLMHKALFLVYAEGLWTVEERHLQAAAADTPAVSGLGPARKGVITIAVDRLRHGDKRASQTQASDADHEWFWRCVSGLLLAGLAWIAWVVYQLQAPHLVTDEAYKAAEGARRSTAGVVAPMPPRAAYGETEGNPASTMPVLGRPLRMAETIETRIHGPEGDAAPDSAVPEAK